MCNYVCISSQHINSKSVLENERKWRNCKKHEEIAKSCDFVAKIKVTVHSINNCVSRSLVFLWTNCQGHSHQPQPYLKGHINAYMSKSSELIPLMSFLILRLLFKWQTDRQMRKHQSQIWNIYDDADTNRIMPTPNCFPSNNASKVTHSLFSTNLNTSMHFLRLN